MIVSCRRHLIRSRSAPSVPNMVIESKDEVFGWFKQLSGAYRIEVLTTLLHSCVPLEKRFFASVIETLARADYCALLDDEQKANTAADMESLCARDWLEDVVPHVPVHDAAQNGLVPVPKSLVVADAAVRVPPAGPADPVQAGDSAAVSFHAPPQPPPQQKPPLIPVRQQVVISMCLLNSTNRLCATILVKAIQKHLSVENLQRHLQIVIHGTDRGKEKPVLQTQVAAPDHQVVSEITLIFSLAFCHPAFTLEQQHLLSYQVSRFPPLADRSHIVHAAKGGERLSELTGKHILTCSVILLPASSVRLSHCPVSRCPVPVLLSHYRSCS